MPQINIGTIANDGTGDPLRTAFQKVDQYGFLSDKTVNAAFYKTANITTEAALNLAIPAAAALGTGAAVWTPASMLPFNANLVSFNNAVKMTAEGQIPDFFNVRAYGAAGDGVTDDTTAINKAIIAAANATGALQAVRGNVVFAPAGKYLCTATIQLPIAVNDQAVTLRGAHVRSCQFNFSGPTTNFTVAPTTPALLLMGSATPDAAGTSANIIQFAGIENLTVDGSLLTGGGNVRGVQITEGQNCWMEAVIIQNLPNSSTGLYLRGATVTGGLGAATRPETRECIFRNVTVNASIGTGATSTPSAMILQNADENNFYGCVFGLTPGLTGTGVDSIFDVWIQLGRQNRFFGVLMAGDITTNKTQYVGTVFGPPVNEAGAANGSVLQNQTYGDWFEGFDICTWNRIDLTGNTNGNALYNANFAIYNTTFKDDNAVNNIGPGGAFSFIVLSAGLGPPDGPINYLSGIRPQYVYPATWATGTTTPDVSGGEFFITGNGSPTTITNFLNPKPGQKWTIYINDANTTIASSGNIVLQNGVNVLFPSGSLVHFFYDGRATFNRLEVSRTTGTPFTALTEAVLVSGLRAPATPWTFETTLTAARVVGAPLTPFVGQRISNTFIQDGTGGRVVTWNAVFKNSWSDTGNTLNKRSTISHIYDGTSWNQDGAQTPYV